MRRTRMATAAAALLALAATACGGGTTTGGGGSNDNPGTLTYWASNQGISLEHDERVLRPQLERFEELTGIEVELEVIDWDQLLDRILAATTSGEGPDVLNIGNTWSASLQATGALMPWGDEEFEAIGGRDRFVESALEACGAPGQDPAAVPLYSLAYALYYNRELFDEAGIEEPPATWEELIEVGQQLTDDDTYGLAIEGASYTTNAHHAFTFGQQHGADFFDEEGNPTFDTPEAARAIEQYIDLLGEADIAAPGNAEYAQNQSLSDFSSGRAAMLLWQAAGRAVQEQGMDPDAYGVAPVPFQANPPEGGRHVNSMVAGINIAVFGNTDNLDGALEFVEFMTSDETQRALNQEFGSLPPVLSAQEDPVFDTEELNVLRDTLANSAAPLPQVPEESQFETLVGTAMTELFAEAAQGRDVTEERVLEKLTEAQQQIQQ
ncbi:sugar ABC transporter substrate-binding protein [Streptomyces sp. 7-21]|jgi:multiple sugar transport system substrate-binding protein|uniref:ABC transporter substrate-binding protein n=1 Tax=Streptomyces sp. 7-21 TaxID=2802283 RepID=UPI00191E4BEA|nr:sugar ABC transporter substrate-binding protein [Streptomyces sp. 7-21]MBL1068801.1 sugar ABC transporter substrate-binding protein [Streptomyces sp. 7-21]